MWLCHACESTVRYVFGLIWPQACIDCSLNEDCYLVGVREVVVRVDTKRSNR